MMKAKMAIGVFTVFVLLVAFALANNVGWRRLYRSSRVYL